MNVNRRFARSCSRKSWLPEGGPEMAWPPPSTFPVEPPPQPGWWVGLSYNRLVARGLAERRAREQDERWREIRRRIERLNEALCLMESAAPAYRVEGVSKAARHLSRCGVESRSRSAGPEVEHFVGRQVGPLEMWQADRDEAEVLRQK
jgi:hypothetical protein